MNAMQQVLEYISRHNNTDMTDQEFGGQMAVEGIIINRTPNSRTAAKLTRTGKTITITETTIEENVIVLDSNDRPVLENGSLKMITRETTAEVLRVEL